MSFHERLAAALAAGTSEHYEDASLYDHEYKRRRDDVRWYQALAKKELKRGSDILELGCGSGRTLIPLARDGWRVTGVDNSATMLDRCRERLARFRDVRVELVRADFRSLALRRRFPLVICPFNAFMHLYSRQDVERFLEVVRAHLQPGGLFAFDVMNPDLAWLSRDPNRRWARTRFRHPRTGKLTYYSTSLSYDAALQIAFMRIYYEPAGGGRTRTIRLTHRQFFPLELEALLHYNGFSVEAHEGGFDGAPLVPESEEQVLRCRSRRGISVSRRKNI
ncbi:MAG TPA: class I SAM-dependent methyltransferase [Polyangia bacterium]|nr:class I SAM-dependent methyltransferase [Polyangia bacterium]